MGYGVDPTGETTYDRYLVASESLRKIGGDLPPIRRRTAGTDHADRPLILCS